MKTETTLTKQDQFRAVLGKGATQVGRLMVIKTLPASPETSRYGIVASKKVGNAVARNRTKRRLREVFRQAPLKAGWDIVIIARPVITKAEYKDINREAGRLLARANIIADSNEKTLSGID